jgi:hypothetical protein
VRHLHQSAQSRLTGCLSTLPRSHSDLRIRRIPTKVDVDLTPHHFDAACPKSLPALQTRSVAAPERRQSRDPRNLISRSLRIKRSAGERYDLNAGVVLRSNSRNNPGGRFIGAYGYIAIVAIHGIAVDGLSHPTPAVCCMPTSPAFPSRTFVASDPLNSRVVGWFAGELRAPN